MRRETAESHQASLSRRRFLQGGALAAASFLLPPALSHATSNRRLLRVPFRYQLHSLTCEIAALRMAAEYFGYAWAEDVLLRIMPRDAGQPRREGENVVWVDPNRVFPGNFHGWQLYRGGLREHPERTRRGQWGYGIHAPVIADVAHRLGLTAMLFDRIDAVYAAIDRGHVPIVIVPDGGREDVVKWRWYTPSGEAVTVINAEHSVVVRGYDEQTVWVNDPKGKVWTYPRDRFERAYALLRSGVAIGPVRRAFPKITPC